MNFGLILLRIIHIGSAILWVGAGATMLFIVTPTVRRLGKLGGTFMGALLLYSPFSTLFSIVSVLTTLSGVALFIIVSGTLNPLWFSNPSAIVLSIGSVFGLLAFGHGSAALSKYTSEGKQLAQSMQNLQGSPPEELQAKLDRNIEKINLHSKISFSLMVVAVVLMASHRYVIW